MKQEKTEYEQLIENDKLQCDKNLARKLVYGLIISIIILFVGYSSITLVPVGKVAIIYKLTGKQLPPGHVVALNGEKGLQPDMIASGVYIRPCFKFLNDIKYVNIITIPKDYVGVITALGGELLPKDKIVADPWPEKEILKMLDVRYFLTHGGQKGVQATMLKPGKYHINTGFFVINLFYTETMEWRFKEEATYTTPHKEKRGNTK